MIESLLLSVTRVSTLLGEQLLTNATGFFFERNARLFLVTNRHVVLDESSNHRPDRLQIELHVDPDNAALTTNFIIPLYRENQPAWREASTRPARWTSSLCNLSARRCRRSSSFSRLHPII